MAGRWTAETVYQSIMEAIKADLFPRSLDIKSFFGMASPDRSICVPVLGVWETMWAKGLLTKDALKTAIVDNDIENFFWNGVRKLAAVGHGYARMLEGVPVCFTKIYSFGPEPARNVLEELKQYLLDAMDTFCEPVFQTAETQKSAWDKLDDLVRIAVFLPHQSGLLEALVEAQEGYDETREIYGMTRTAPVCLKARIAALRML